MSIQTIGAIINVLKWTYDHRQEESIAAEVGIHFLRHVEHLVVKHHTSLDDLLVHADKSLTAYNKSNKSNVGSSSSSEPNVTTVSKNTTNIR